MPNIEIERKFLITGNFKSDAYKSERVTQGYMACNTEGRAVRIRIKGDKGFITIKGASNDSGLSRFEWEKEIPVEDAAQLMKLCDPGVIDKVRYFIKSGVHNYEVDEFHGDNEGLIIAEIELTSENEKFEKPSWLGQEVTGDVRYYNSQLVKNPYKNWKTE
uniref:CYTH domain-containing protein n=1 Tax=uncultured Dysgonomonas sp. TaxID=206096 RepID=UPI0026352466|nr:CYTH domain-containing protein [uncultured Dysgonomonas sp.]